MSGYSAPYFDALLTAHGVLGGIAWVILFPLGGIVIRVFNHPSVFWWHAGIQLLAYAMFCVTFGSGVWFSILYGGMSDPHPIIGTILFGLTTLQPFLGTVHHKRFNKVGRRTFLAILHIQLGRMLITVGMINGGLGLLLGETAKVSATDGEFMAYGIVSGIVWMAYIIIVSSTEIYDVKKWYVEDEETSSADDLERTGSYDDEEKAAEAPVR